VVIDAPPQIGDATRAIVDVADVILIPALASTADIMATGKALSLIRRAREKRPDKGPKALLVPSRVDRRTAAGKEIEAVLLEFGEPVAPMVRQRTAFVDCFTAGQWIGAYARNSDAHVDIQTLAAVVRRMLGHAKTS
jgi:chromosome partitioning protein